MASAIGNLTFLSVMAHCNAMLEFRQTGCHRKCWRHTPSHMCKSRQSGST